MPETEIVVYGIRLNYGGATGLYRQEQGSGVGSDFDYIDPDGGGGGGEMIPPNPTDQDPPAVAAECLNPANKARIEAAAKKIIDWVTATTPKITALSDTALITLKDGHILTGEQLKVLWGKADFLVTDRTDFGIDRGGAVIGFLSQMSLTTVEGWNVHTGGLNFILFHEIAHMSSQAKEYGALQWTIFLDNGGIVLANGTAPSFNSTNQQFVNGEVYVNDASKQIANLLGNTPILVDTSDADPRKWVPPFGV